MKVKGIGGATAPLENGVYTAVCTQVIDLGMQYSEKFKKSSRRLILGWEILGESVEIDGEECPRMVTKEYGFSIGERSNLRKDLKAWRNKDFTKEELEGFEIGNLLNVPCNLQLNKNERDYNEIVSITTLPKGTQIAAEDTNKQVILFDTEDNNTWNMYSLIPQWIQKKIQKSDNFENSELKKYLETQKLFTPVPEGEAQLPF